jgi:hypothetical protein
MTSPGGGRDLFRLLLAEDRDPLRPELLKRGCFLPQGGGDLAKVADLRCLRSHPVHAPSRQHRVGIFEELGVVQQRPDRLVLAATFDGPQMEVQTWPGERFIGLEFGDVLGETAG